MEPEITINNFSKHLFWDVDLSQFDLDRYPEFMVQRVLEYGVLADWKALVKLYGDEKIKKCALELRSLNPISLSFLATRYGIDQKEFRCYKYRQLVQNSWNS